MFHVGVACLPTSLQLRASSLQPDVMFHVAGGMAANMVKLETYIKESGESQGSLVTICYTHNDIQVPCLMLQVACLPTSPRLRVSS